MTDTVLNFEMNNWLVTCCCSSAEEDT